MDPLSCDRGQVTTDEALTRLVGDVMLANPKTLPGQATVGDARVFFGNPKVVTAVVVDGERFVGLLDRSDLPSLLPDSSPVRTFARRGVPTTSPSELVSDAMAVLHQYELARLVVLGEDGVTLAGLLCLDLGRSGFCQG
jgi:CBS domain-containing protein